MLLSLLPEPLLQMWSVVPSLLLEVLEGEKHIVHEGAPFPGWRRLCPASHHCHIPACWFSVVSRTGWEPSQPLRGIISPLARLCLFASSFPFPGLCVCHHSKNFGAIQSDDQCNWDPLGRKAASITSCLKRQCLLPRTLVVEGEGCQLCTGSMPEPTSLKVKCY